MVDDRIETAGFESRRHSLRLPRPLWIGVAAVVLLVAGFGMRMSIPAYRHNLAIQHLRERGIEIYSDTSRVGPDWLRHWIGKARLAPFGRVQNLDLSRSKITDADLADVKQLNGLEWLALNRNPITDEGVAHLCEISTLKALRIEDTRVTDACLARLAHLRSLEVLSLKRTRVTGSGLKHLKALPRLHFLDLEGNRLDDAILADLKDLTGLRELRLGDTNVSSAGIDELDRILGIRIQRTDERGWRAP